MYFFIRKLCGTLFSGSSIIFVLQDHCHYLFSEVVSYSFYRSSVMFILQEHYRVFVLQEQLVFILQEQCVFILQEQSRFHFTWVVSSLFFGNVYDSVMFILQAKFHGFCRKIIMYLFCAASFLFHRSSVNSSMCLFYRSWSYILYSSIILYISHVL